MTGTAEPEPATSEEPASFPGLRAVLDANVVASALVNPAGVPGKIVMRLFADAAFESIVSAATLAELRRCVTYPRLRPYIRMEDAVLARWIDNFAFVSVVVGDEPLPSAPVVQDDPDDDLYLAVATTGMAVYVVSGDRHLLGLRTYGGITIVPPRQFLQLLDRAL